MGIRHTNLAGPLDEQDTSMADIPFWGLAVIQAKHNIESNRNQAYKPYGALRTLLVHKIQLSMANIACWSLAVIQAKKTIKVTPIQDRHFGKRNQSDDGTFSRPNPVTVGGMPYPLSKNRTNETGEGRIISIADKTIGVNNCWYGPVRFWAFKEIFFHHNCVSMTRRRLEARWIRNRSVLIDDRYDMT